MTTTVCPYCGEEMFSAGECDMCGEYATEADLVTIPALDSMTPEQQLAYEQGDIDKLKIASAEYSDTCGVVIDIDNAVWDENGWESGDDVIIPVLAEALKEIAPRVTRDDLDYLEDQNFHAAYAAIEYVNAVDYDQKAFVKAKYQRISPFYKWSSKPVASDKVAQVNGWRVIEVEADDEGYCAHLINDKLGYDGWMDAWGSIDELEFDWNQYIFQTDNSNGVLKSKIQSNADNFMDAVGAVEEYLMNEKTAASDEIAYIPFDGNTIEVASGDNLIVSNTRSGVWNGTVTVVDSTHIKFNTGLGELEIYHTSEFVNLFPTLLLHSTNRVAKNIGYR